MIVPNTVRQEMFGAQYTMSSADLRNHDWSEWQGHHQDTSFERKGDRECADARRTKPDQEAAASLPAEQLAEMLKRTYLIGSLSRAADRRTANASSGVLHYLLSIALAAGPGTCLRLECVLTCTRQDRVGVQGPLHLRILVQYHAGCVFCWHSAASLKACVVAEQAAVAQEACKSIVAGFFGNRKLRIQRKLIEDVLRRHTGTAEALLPDIISHAASARTVFLQGEAVALLLVIAKLPQASLCNS